MRPHLRYHVHLKNSNSGTLRSLVRDVRPVPASPEIIGSDTGGQPVELLSLSLSFFSRGYLLRYDIANILGVLHIYARLATRTVIPD